MARAPTDTCNHADTVNPLTDLGWLLATSYNRLVEQADRQLAPLELTAAQYGVVMLLERGRASTPSELCRLMDYDRGAMTRLLQRLKAKGVLTQVPNPKDRRAQTLKLTEKGRLLHQQARPILDALHQQALQGLNQDEAKAIAALLYRVIHNLS